MSAANGGALSRIMPGLTKQNRILGPKSNIGRSEPIQRVLKAPPLATGNILLIIRAAAAMVKHFSIDIVLIDHMRIIELDNRLNAAWLKTPAPGH